MKNLPDDQIIDGFHIVCSVGTKVCPNSAIEIDRKNGLCKHPVILGLGALRHTFALPLVLSILRRVTKKLLPLYRVFFQPSRRASVLAVFQIIRRTFGRLPELTKDSLEDLAVAAFADGFRERLGPDRVPGPSQSCLLK